MKALLEFMAGAALALLTIVLAAFLLAVTAQGADFFDTNNTANWQYSGLPEGSAKAKSDSMTMFADVTQAPWNVLNNGAGDQSLKINAAYQACPSNQYLYFPAGLYSGSTNLVMNRSGVELRGAGSRASFLIYTNHTAGSPPSQFFFWQPSAWDFDWTASTNSAMIAGFTQGSTNMHVFTNSWRVGSAILLDERADGPALDRVGSTSTPTFTSRSSTDNSTFTNDAGRRAHQQLVHVTALSGNGQTNVTFWPPIAMSYTATNLPQAVEGKNFLYYGGLRDLCFTNTGSATTAVRDHIFMGGVVYGWIKDCEFALSRRRIMWGYSFYYCELEGNFFHHGIGGDWTSGYDPDRAYGIFTGLTSTGNRIVNNAFWKMHFGLATEGAGAYNFFGYNYVTNVLFNNGYTCQPTTGNHACGTHFNAWEGNIFEEKVLADTFFGNGVSNTFIRNVIRNAPKGGTDYTTNKDQYASVVDLWGYAVNGSRGHYNYTFIGNILGARGQERYYDAPEGINVLQETGNYHIWRMGHTNANVDNYSTMDTNVAWTLRRLMNWDSVTVTNGGLVNGGTWSTNDIPKSLVYVNGDPDWGQAEGWPIRGQIGPHVATNTTAIFLPARERLMAWLGNTSTNFLTRRIIDRHAAVRGIRRLR